MSTQQFQVRKDQLGSTRCVSLPHTPLAAGQVRVRVEHFAYTSNNITYAAFGEAMHYWQFYPVPADADGTAWGCIPVWGFATVAESLHPEVAVGERLYGYWPMASHAVVQPVRIGPHGFTDGSPHRAPLHAVYNLFLRCDADPYYTVDSEAVQALLRPLFLTAWLIDDFLADNGFFGTTASGARAVLLLSSASSKTACASAALLAQRPEVRVVGLTAERNLAFCRSLGVYEQVLTYDEIDTLPANTPCIYVDFAGDGPLRRAVHSRFQQLAYSCSIGGTHLEHLAGGRDLPGPRPVLFFAPAQVKKRSADWGPGDLNRRMVAAWHAYRLRVCESATPWLKVQWHRGPAAVQGAHQTVLAGRGDPRLGHMLSLAG